MTKLRVSLILILLLGVCGPIRAQTVQTDYDHGVSFAQYHTYSWGRVHFTNPLFEQRIRDDVNRELQAKGWQVVPEGGTVTLTAVGVRRNQLGYQTFYDSFGPGWRWRGWGGSTAITTVERVPVGTVIVDIYDSSSKQLIWRGLAQDTLSDNPEKNTKKLSKAVNKMFKKFPPK